MAAERAWYESEKVWLVHKDGFSLGEIPLLPSRRESRLKSSPLLSPPSHRHQDGRQFAAGGEGEDPAGARWDRPGRGRRRRGEGK